MRKIIGVLCVLCGLAANAQNDSVTIRKIYDEALVRGHAYKNLYTLCKSVGARISGSPQAQKAVEWGKSLMESYGFDTVFLQPMQVPNWKRSSLEKATLMVEGNTSDTRSSKNKLNQPVKITALGGSVGTNGKVKAELVQVNSYAELKKMPAESLKGKIVFINEAMEPSNISTFTSYGPCVQQRVFGADAASKAGALAVIIRSVTLATDDHPHTGSLHYNDSVQKIPAAAVSTQTSDFIAAEIKKGKKVSLTLELGCHWEKDTISYNVVGEIRGSKYPNEYIIVGGHLDSWDIGEGAHDDGAGCVHSIEALRLFKAAGIRPQHSLRAVLYMNEENGLRGGYKYAELVGAKKEKHLAAIESDRGGLVPRGFSTEKKEHIEKMRSWAGLFKPYDIHYFETGGSGADVGRLRNIDSTAALIGFIPDSQRYFDFHHCENDVFENVNKRELELGAAAIASLMYLIDKYRFD